MITVINTNKFSIPCSTCSTEMYYTRRRYAHKRLQEHARCIKCRTCPTEKKFVFFAKSVNLFQSILVEKEIRSTYLILDVKNVKALRIASGENIMSIKYLNIKKKTNGI